MCASLELLLQAADIISKREQTGEPVVVPNVNRLAAKLAYIVAYDSAMSTGSESSESSDNGSDNGSDSDNGAVPSRASQNKPYKRPATSKRKHQQSKKLALAEQNKTDAQLKGAAQHNEVEKRRRAYLAHCYSALKLAVPGLEKSKASNVTVLRAAVDEIKRLEETGRKLEAAKAEQYCRRKTLLESLPAHYRLQYPTTPPPLSDTSEAYDSEDTAAVPDFEDRHLSDSEQDATTSSVFAYSTELPPHLPIKESSIVPASGGQAPAQPPGGWPRPPKTKA